MKPRPCQLKLGCDKGQLKTELEAAALGAELTTGCGAGFRLTVVG